MEETTFTNNAAETAEAGLTAKLRWPSPSAACRWRRSPLAARTDEQLRSVPSMAAYINNRLAYMLEARLDSQILNATARRPI
jgi:hypothetical protein